MTDKPAKSWLAGLKWILIVVIVMAAVRGYTHRGITQGMAPPIEGLALDGEWLSLAELRGRPVLVHFWASWCPVCRREQGSIESIARDYPVIAIAMQSGTAAQVQAYLHENAMNAPVLVDEHGDLARIYGVRAVPASFILDGHGMIRYVEVGYTTEAGLRARLWFAGR